MSVAARAPGQAFVLLAVVLTVAAILIVLFAPLTSVVVSAASVGPAGTQAAPPVTFSMRTEISAALVAALLVPLAFSALPLLAPGAGAALRLRAVAAVGLIAWVVVAVLSVGVMFAPAAAAMVVAAGVALRRG